MISRADALLLGRERNQSEMKKSLVIALIVISLVLVALAGYPVVQRVRAKALLSDALLFQRDGNWPRMETALRRAIELQPDYEEAWECLAWNYCYNICVEFDDVEQKYSVVKRGIEIAIEGVTKNPKSSRLQWDVGWDFFHRIGKSDEREQFRHLFAEDIELHQLLNKHIQLDDAVGPDGKPDNFLVASLWFTKAGGTAEHFGLDEKRMGASAFYSYPAHARMQFALAIENEGVTDETAVRAWQQAAKAWHAYGDRDFEYIKGKTIRYNDYDRLVALKQELDQQKTPQQPEGSPISRKTREVEEKLYWTDRFRTMINFGYWVDRCALEQTEPWLAARRLMVEARRQAAKGHTASEKKAASLDLFDQAFAAWAKILKDNPPQEDDVLLDELLEHIRIYRITVLDGAPLPPNFPFRELIEKSDRAEAEMQRIMESAKKEYGRSSR